MERVGVTGPPDLIQPNALEPGRSVRPVGGSVSVLEPAMWKHLLDATEFTELASAWLVLQCEMIGVAQTAVVVRNGDNGERYGVAIWPNSSTDVSTLSPIIDQALDQKRGIIQRPNHEVVTSNEGQHLQALELSRLAYPLEIHEELYGAVALEVSTAAAESIRKVMRELQWGVAWLRERLLLEQVQTYRRFADQTASALELLATVLDRKGFSDACRVLVTEMALRTNSVRVSAGFRRNGASTVRSISHSATFKDRMNLVHMLGTAMDEAVDQRSIICFPPSGDEPYVHRAHDNLARAHGSQAILTVPMFVHASFVGALCFERSDETSPFDVDEIVYIESVSAVIGPILEEKRQNDRWIIVKIGDSAIDELRRYLGPGHFKRKIATVVAMMIVTFFYFAISDYYVTGEAVIEGRIQRVIAATFDGFIKDAPVRAGDFVNLGQLVVRLDDRDLILERMRWVTQRQQSVYEYERALGNLDRVESRIAQSKIEQAEARLDLVDQQIGRTRITAPFDGMIVSGDLSRSIGAAVQRGEVLLEIAPLDSYRIDLKIDESQIGDVKPGYPGQLRVASIPNETFSIIVKKITPVAIAEEGRNFFRVEAHLKGSVDALRPGMNGVGHIFAGERRLIWIWTRTFVDWFHVFVWRWFQWPNGPNNAENIL